jgi:hypothetical protein
MHMHPSHATNGTESFASPTTKRGRRSADRRIEPRSAPHFQMLPPEGAPGAEARHTPGCRHPKVLRARSPLGAPQTALVAATERLDSAQAALHAIKRMQALPAPSTALKRCTSRPGRCAGGDDTQAARERGHKPRPQEPHSPRVQVCASRTRPSDEGRDSLGINT